MDASLPALDEADVRAIVRLLGEVAASRRDGLGMKRMLMGGLLDLVGADAWSWSLGRDLEAGRQPTYVSMAHGGFDDERYGRLLCAAGHPDMARMSEALIGDMQERRSHITRAQQQFLVMDDYRACGFYPFMCEADLGPFMVSFRPIDESSVSTIAIYRRLDEADFTARESRIAHIVLSEIPWLHEQGWPEDRGATVPRLSPRTRVVLNMLLDGRSRKDIAAHLALSEGTVASYQKTIYRHFQVNSHAALMRRFQMGDGGDR